jgi:hypothetical protein
MFNLWFKGERYFIIDMFYDLKVRDTL